MKQPSTIHKLHYVIANMDVSAGVRKLHDHAYSVLVDGVADNDFTMNADDFYALACFAVDPEHHNDPEEYVSAITQNMTRLITGMLFGLPEGEIIQSLGVRMDRLEEVRAEAKKEATKKPTSPLRLVWDADKEAQA